MRIDALLSFSNAGDFSIKKDQLQADISETGSIMDAILNESKVDGTFKSVYPQVQADISETGSIMDAILNETKVDRTFKSVYPQVKAITSAGRPETIL